MLILAALLLVSEPVRTLELPRPDEPTLVTYARDSRYEYLATPAGLYRSEKLLDSSKPLERIAFAGRVVNHVAVHEDVLYVLLGNGVFSSSPDNTFLRSFDFGATFHPLDNALRTECYQGTCEYLIGTRVAFADGVIFVDSGRNVLVTTDEGASWNILYGLPGDGKPVTQLCPVVFERIGTRLLMGGECPLDVGWISGGTLRSDFRGWESEPQPVDMPYIENRNVQFLRRLPDGVVWAGIEGALLKSTDGGSSFDFVIHYPIESSIYPYIAELVSSSRDPRLMLIGGFDKGNASPWLAFSTDRGARWTTHALPYEDEAANVALIAEDRDGAMFLVLQDGGRYSVRTIEVSTAPRRRAVSR